MKLARPALKALGSGVLCMLGLCHVGGGDECGRGAARQEHRLRDGALGGLGYYELRA